MSSWILNASPLIVLGRAELLKVISPLVETWIIPEGVIRELSIKTNVKPFLSQLSVNAEVITKSVKTIDPFVGNWNLGLGESEVLTLGINEQKGVVLDDLQARKCAKNLEISLTGSLGLVLMAKRNGIIQKVRPVFENLVQAGLYIDSKLINAILKAINEK